ncbi:hypothetical protein UY3_03539 [Chelonia mydas]|uniref:Uncharacterized protein n=1 Tax=Chelonia mydas TaxID=8469 RepID=M7BPI5_CHEMY|nr:hypothetical protein UY3_03539 [Chelonia mydas]
MPNLTRCCVSASIALAEWCNEHQFGMIQLQPENNLRDEWNRGVKVKELWNAFHKVQEANVRSDAVPMSCRFYRELDTKATVDPSVAGVPVESEQSQEEEILDEDVEGEGDPEAEDDSEGRDACRQALFSTPEASQSQLWDLGETQTGEEAPAGESSTKRHRRSCATAFASSVCGPEMLFGRCCCIEGVGTAELVGSSSTGTGASVRDHVRDKGSTREHLFPEDTT